MSWMDFNDAPKQESYELIPAGTIATVAMKIKPGGAGEGGWFRASNSSDSIMLDCEFTVTQGPFARRKIFQFIGISGGKQNDKGESIFGNMGKAMIRAILESARNINPDDQSQQAMEARRINSLDDFQGMEFRARIGIQKDKTGTYDPKNCIKDVVTPDMKGYVDDGNSATAPGIPSSQPAAPAWANSGQSTTPPPPPSEATNPTPAWAR